MDHIFKLIFMRNVVFLSSLLLTSIALADTYSALSTTIYFYNDGVHHETSTGQALCDELKGSDTRPWDFALSPSRCVITNTDGTTVSQPVNGPMTQYSCPAGGTLSGTNCINAPACTAGQYRLATTKACTTPKFCLYPETDDGTYHCAVPDECTVSGNLYRYSTRACETPPTCAATESFNAYTWSCQLKYLNCPGHR